MEILSRQNFLSYRSSTNLIREYFQHLKTLDNVLVNDDYIINKANDHGVLCFGAFQLPNSNVLKRNRLEPNEQGNFEPQVYIAHSSIRKKVSKFFKDHASKILTVAVTNGGHEGCIFIKKNRLNKYEFRLYNPNHDELFGNGFSLIRYISCSTKYVDVISSDHGNLDGMCSFYTWERIHLFLLGQFNPWTEVTFYTYNLKANKKL